MTDKAYTITVVEVDRLGALIFKNPVKIRYGDIPFGTEFADLKIGDFHYRYEISQNLEYLKAYLGYELMNLYKGHPELQRECSYDKDYQFGFAFYEGHCFSCANFRDAIRDGNHECHWFAYIDGLCGRDCMPIRYPDITCKKWVRREEEE